nr:hypothetical protein CFP56_12158 [Quercus suber]
MAWTVAEELCHHDQLRRNGMVYFRTSNAVVAVFKCRNGQRPALPTRLGLAKTQTFGQRHRRSRPQASACNVYAGSSGSAVSLGRIEFEDEDCTSVHDLSHLQKLSFNSSRGKGSTVIQQFAIDRCSTHRLTKVICKFRISLASQGFTTVEAELRHWCAPTSIYVLGTTHSDFCDVLNEMPSTTPD